MVEVNASDARAKADSNVTKGIGGKVSNMVKELTTNRSFAHTGWAGSSTFSRTVGVRGGRLADWRTGGLAGCAALYF